MQLTRFSFASLAVLGLCSLSSAQTLINWVGSNGAWENAANWQTVEAVPVNRVPINGDKIQPMAPAAGVTITYSATTGTQNLANSGVVQRVATSTKFLQTGGTLNVNSFLLTSTKAAVAAGHINYELRGGTVYADYRSTFTWDNARDRATRFLQTGGSARFGSTENHGLSMAHKSSTQVAYYDLQGGAFEAGYLRLGSGGADQTAVFTQSGASQATINGKLHLGAVAGTTGQSVYNLDGGTLTIENTIDPFVFTQPGAPAYFDFDGGTLLLEGTWNFASLMAIANSDFRVLGQPATVGTLFFEPASVNGMVFTRIIASGTYGSGCQGTNGIPQLSFTGESSLGKTLDVNLSSAPPTAGAFLNVGFTNSAPFPIDLSIFGATGCSMYNDPFATASIVTNGTGVGQVSIAIPMDPGLVGLRVFVQWLCLDSLANSIGLTTSNGGIAVVRT